MRKVYRVLTSDEQLVFVNAEDHIADEENIN